MTHRDYYFSDAIEGTAQVLACVAVDGLWSVELDRTLFHPQGGGQLADTGWINDLPVLGVEAQGERIHHLVEQALPLGEVQLKIDAQARLLHERLHTAGHLIGYVGQQSGLRPTKAQHWPNASRVVFELGDNAPPNLADLQNAVQALLAQNLKRAHQEKDGLRWIGFGDLPAFPCGGTHVRELAELGQVSLLDMKCKKNLVTISYDVLA